ncbi:MAG: hypothetical protein P1V51_03930 [Deltaproteobacteria bacterium]|nr:hypothetical protein [Deltaproteobacteria bacterium]
MRRAGRKAPIQLILICLALGIGGVARAESEGVDPAAMTAKEYKLYKDYLNALEDPRVQKMKAAQRLPRIARNFGVTTPELKKAVTKGEKSAEGLVAANQADAEKALKASEVGGQITSIELVEVDGTIVGYVSWNAAQKERLTHDAVYLAQAISESAPLTNVWAMWACMGKKKVWTGMIRPSAANRIDAARIEDFAQTRYLRLFEEVHNFFEGTPPEKPKRDPETGKEIKDPKTGKPVMEPDPSC